MLSQQSAYVFAHLNANGYPQFDGWWYIFNCVTHLLVWGAIAAIFYVKEYNKWSKILTYFGVLLATSQLVDEKLGDPTKIQANEYVVAGIIIGVTVVVGVKDLITWYRKRETSLSKNARKV